MDDNKKQDDRLKDALMHTLKVVFWTFLILGTIGLLSREALLCIGVIAVILLFVGVCYNTWCKIFRR